MARRAGTTGPTLSDRLYGSLRESIVLGRLKPGEKLMMSEIAAREGVSFNVVREALNRLTGEKLVHSAPQLGFSVASMTVPELRDLLDVRIEIESVGVRWSVDRADIEWQSDLVAAYHRLSKTHALEPGLAGVTDEWQRAHLQFHRAMFAGSGNPRLVELANALSDEYALYRGWALSMLSEERLGLLEHEQMMNAALEGNADLATECLRDHYRRTAEVLFDALESLETSVATP